jgi:hypothetical protein
LIDNAKTITKTNETSIETIKPLIKLKIKFSFVEEDFVFENDITIPLKKIYATVKFL